MSDKKNLAKKRNTTLVARFQSISIDKKACLFVFLMSVAGAVAGTIDARIAFKKCLNTENCATGIKAEEIRKVGIGACAGMIAAGILSLPAIVSDRTKE